MKGVTVYLCNFLLLNSVSGLLWESFFGRKLLPKSMNSVGLFRLLMDQPSKLSAVSMKCTFPIKCQENDLDFILDNTDRI